MAKWNDINSSYDLILANGKGKRLLLFMDLINQTVGDALSDMLMVEAILHARGWDVQDWSMAYQVIVPWNCFEKINSK